jgi:hypothetical protein
MNHQLCFGHVVIGQITEVFEHQGTWFGAFRPAFFAAPGPLERRLCEFMAFSEDFNARAAAAQNTDSSEFDRYDDILTSGLWRVLAPSGAISKIRDAPNFLRNGEVSWIAI